MALSRESEYLLFALRCVSISLTMTPSAPANSRSRVCSSGVALPSATAPPRRGRRLDLADAEPDEAERQEPEDARLGERAFADLDEIEDAQRDGREQDDDLEGELGAAAHGVIHRRENEGDRGQGRRQGYRQDRLKVVLAPLTRRYSATLGSTRRSRRRLSRIHDKRKQT